MTSWRLLGLATITLTLFVIFAASLAPVLLDMSDGGVRRVRRNVAELKAGRTKTLHLTGTRHTDMLLDQIRGMPEIEDIFIQDADITVIGMRQLGTLPNLRSMMAYNAIGDDGMLELRTCPKLESVAIYDGRITQSAHGSEFVAKILTVVETCRQQSRGAFGYLTAAIEPHFARTSAPSLLPGA